MAYYRNTPKTQQRMPRANAGDSPWHIYIYILYSYIYTAVWHFMGLSAPIYQIKSIPK